MSKMKNRNLFIRIFAVVVTNIFMFADAISFMKYDSYAGYQCVPKDTLFQSDDVVDALTCGKLCQQTKKCLSFSYQQDYNRCIGCRVDIFGAFAATSQIVPGSVHFSNADLEPDCSEIQAKNQNAKSGVYKIKLWQSKTVIDVYCDMNSYGDVYAWTVLQNRFDGSVNFYRDCEDYENGFGDINGEFWLGLKYIQEIANADDQKNFVKIELSRQNGDKGFEKVEDFGLMDGTNYTLDIYADHFGRDEYKLGIETLPRGMAYGTASFSCKDRDRDEMAVHCAAERHGAWWHKACSEININGEYCTPGRLCDDGNDGKTGFYHKGFAGYESLKTSRMKIRRVFF